MEGYKGDLLRKQYLDIGFKELPHFTIGNNLIYDLGRNRHLSIANLGTPNETLYICKSDPNDFRNITEAICLYNYDYDGFFSVDEIKKIITGITKRQFRTP